MPGCQAVYARVHVRLLFVMHAAPQCCCLLCRPGRSRSSATAWWPWWGHRHIAVAPSQVSVGFLCCSCTCKFHAACRVSSLQHHANLGQQQHQASCAKFSTGCAGCNLGRHASRRISVQVTAISSSHRACHLSWQHVLAVADEAYEHQPQVKLPCNSDIHQR
jgi:hypothetical protein